MLHCPALLIVLSLFAMDSTFAIPLLHVFMKLMILLLPLSYLIRNQLGVLF